MTGSSYALNYKDKENHTSETIELDSDNGAISIRWVSFWLYAHSSHPHTLGHQLAAQRSR